MKGPGLTGCVFLIFLTLKLCGVITWSWWWVTVPLWGVLGLVIILFLLCAVCCGLSETVKAFIKAAEKC